MKGRKGMKVCCIDIKLITFCHPSSKGIIVYDTKLDVQMDNCIIRGDEEHKKYFEKISDDLTKTKPLDKMNAEEIKEQMTDLLIGVDILLHSNYCTLDKYSNVSRFITIAHDNYRNVFDIRYPNDNTEMYWTACPAYW